MSIPRKTRPFTWGVLVGIAVLLTFGITLNVAVHFADKHRFSEGPTLSHQQIQTVSDAIRRYADSHGQRPAHLEALVTEKLISPADLVDENKAADSPAIDPSSGRFTAPVDVLYFPAVRAADPLDLLLLCTLTVHKKGDKYLAAYNDGRILELSAPELTQALQHTYDYFRGKLSEPQSQPAEN